MATRAKKAAELAGLLERGPVIGLIGNGINKQELEEIQRTTKLWLDTWVAPLCRDLIPELRKDRSNG